MMRKFILFLIFGVLLSNKNAYSSAGNKREITFLPTENDNNNSSLNDSSESIELDNATTTDEETTISLTTTIATATTTSLVALTEKCDPPSINDFPTDLFSQRQRRFGGILFHILFTAYLFVLIMNVCDDYFMHSLEIIGQKLNLDQDVAGATFMAAGSSAPEVFISLIGVFVSETATGIGAIVGSAMFNILFVIGICALFIQSSAKLAFWPFFRDSIFYCISILALVLLIRDDKVYWYESLALLILYAAYIFFMINNDRLKEWTYGKFKMLEQETNNILPERGQSNSLHNKSYDFLTKKNPSRSHSGYNRFSDDDEMYAWGGTLENITQHADNHNIQQQNNSYQNSGKNYTLTMRNVDHEAIANADALVASNTRLIGFDTAVIVVMLKLRYFRPKTRFIMAVRRVIDEILWVKRSSIKNNQNLNRENYDYNPLNLTNLELFLSDRPDVNQPYGWLKFIKWIIFLPAKMILYYTIPDCRLEKYKKWYILTFVSSIIWLALLSYLIVWMVTVIGYTIGIPDSLMAITLIAASTSIPDAYTSIIVVREGMVDMGVSNIFGSNVFDLLIGLAFPWFIKSIFNNGFVKINSNGLIYDSMLLYACVLVTICMIHLRKWYLDRRSGYIFLSVYAAFIIFSSAIELNLFSYVNPPMCS